MAFQFLVNILKLNTNRHDKRKQTKQYRSEVVVVFFLFALIASWFFVVAWSHFTSRLALAGDRKLPAAKHPTPSSLHKGL